MNSPSAASNDRCRASGGDLLIIKDVLTACVASADPDLTERQLCVLLWVYLDVPANGHTVRGLAATLNVSKPAITRALDRLGEMDLIKRAIDPLDRRSVLVTKTSNGSTYIRTLGKYVGQAKRHLEQEVATAA